MKTYTTKELNENVRNYIINSIEFVDDTDNNNLPLKEKLILLLEQFNSEFNCIQKKKRCPNIINRFADYLQGLPNNINIDFYDFDIINLAKQWHIITELSEKSYIDKIRNNWFNFYSLHFFKLCKKEKIDISEYL